MDATLQISDFRIEKFEITEYGKQNINIPFEGYEFQFTQNLTVNETEKNIQANFTVKLLEKIDAHKKYELAELVIVNIVKIINFDQVIKKEGAQLMIPDGLLLLMNSMTLQHSRGALIALLQNTSYSNAIIPLINPKVLLPSK